MVPYCCLFHLLIFLTFYLKLSNNILFIFWGYYYFFNYNISYMGSNENDVCKFIHNAKKLTIFFFKIKSFEILLSFAYSFRFRSLTNTFFYSMPFCLFVWNTESLYHCSNRLLSKKLFTVILKTIFFQKNFMHKN